MGEKKKKKRTLDEVSWCHMVDFKDEKVALHFHMPILNLFSPNPFISFQFENQLNSEVSSDKVPSSCSYICNLLCSLQTSLMLWCRQLLQEDSTKSDHVQLAGDLLLKCE